MATVIIQVKKGGVCNCQQVQPATNANNMTDANKRISAVLAANQPTGRLVTTIPTTATTAQPVAQTAAAVPAQVATTPTSSVKVKWWPWALAAAAGLVLLVAVSGGSKKKSKDEKKRKR